MQANHSVRKYNGWLVSLIRLARLRLRTLLLVIAIFGLLGGSWSEWDNRWHRNENARRERSCLQQEALHAREASVCRAALQQGKTYDLSRSRHYYNGDYDGAQSWDEELSFHQNSVRHFRDEAARRSRLRQYYQSRLLWPF